MWPTATESTSCRKRRAYNPGDTAGFQVRMPFRSATVLVTVEREGVMEAYVKKVSGREPVISVPVKGNYAPNVFVSALCVRGRVGGTMPTALFDPGKPTYRLGIGEIRVGWKAHELKVRVSAEHDAYKVRGKARIRIRVSRADGRALPKGAEVAVAAVDEGLLELMPNDSWKLLDAMMGRRGYEIETSTAQTQVVGRRHYGLKALPAGGGGGMHSTRELFDTLLFWKGRVRLDGRGEATVEIPLNDSLTSFSMVAVADAGSGLFGTGRTSIRTTQDVMLLSGLPSAGAGRGPLLGPFHRAERLESGDVPHGYGQAVLVQERGGLRTDTPHAGAWGGERAVVAGRCAGRYRFRLLGG